MDLPRGARFGPYEIVAPIAAGGMGEVYRGRDTRLEREVAVKVLPREVATDPERVRRFQQEARAAGVLNHPNVTALYDVGTHDGAPYVVSELLEGQTLRQRIDEGPIPPRKAFEYGVQIAHGLAAAHEKGIVHRDLKPENVFVTRDGRVKILDFGLAKLMQADGEPAEPGTSATQGRSAPGIVLGTAAYMSPEQVRGRPADARSDIFALGAILYEMLCGRRAFRGASAVDTMSAVLREDPPELSLSSGAVPREMERIVQRCLEKNPTERFQSARDLAFHLQSAAAPASGPARLLAGSRAWAWAALTVAALLVGLGAGVLVGTRSRASPPSFKRLTFRRGAIMGARFAPDARTVVYDARWDGQPGEIYSTRSESPESRPLELAPAQLLSVSSTGELAVLLHPRYLRGFVNRGTLARVPLSGGAPRELLEDVQSADWSPDGKSLMIVRDVGGRNRIEYPVGKVLYETGGYASHARVSPHGDRVAFLDHPIQSDDGGSVAVVNGAGRKTTLSGGWLSIAGLAWAPGGDEVWFTGAKVGLTRALWGVSLAGKERPILEAMGPLSLHDVAEGRALLSRDDLRREIVGFVPGDTRERSLSWLDWSRATHLSDDGRTLLFSEQGEGAGRNASVYVRRTDGTAPVRLGEGISTELSPDGKWALALKPGNPTQLQLLPLGAGDVRPLTRDAINHQWATWCPDGACVVFSGDQPGHGVRLYLQPLDGSAPRPLTPEGVRITSHPVSPDGRTVAAVGPGDQGFLYPLRGGEPEPLRGMQAGDRPLRWSADGRALFLFRDGELPGPVFRLDLATGRREPWKEFMPSDPAGVGLINPALLTADARHYVYSFRRVLSDLYLAEGLR
jgi:dipeptidyl aminopeptidase/acylaminoacyl peptidase